MNSGRCPGSSSAHRAFSAAALILSFVMTALPAAAQTYHREELRIPFAEAGPRGLEAVLIRPDDGKRYPLAVISHGAPRSADDRPNSSPNRYYTQSIEFARRGFAVLTHQSDSVRPDAQAR